jgi:KaiC/GvpD/RAD55 family RecA-like ATPase
MYNIYLKLLLNYSLYKEYINYIQIPKDHIEVTKILASIIYLQETYNKDISIDEVELHFFANNEIKDKEIPTYKELFNAIRNTFYTEEILRDSLFAIKTRVTAGKLALSAFNLAEGQGRIEDLSTLYEELISPQAEEEVDPFVTSNLETIYEETIKTPGLRWRLSTLNRMLGSLRKGDFGFIFARPETGKTTFLASEITHFATQTKSPILWFNNEEQGNKVMLRCYQASLRKTLVEILANRTKSAEQFKANTDDTIRIYDSASINKHVVEKLCAHYKPSLIIFDQIDKIKGFANDREDLRLGEIYSWARELAKTYAPIIAVSQASGLAEGKKILNMDDVANAKTAKQAEADWILGIGKSHNQEEETIRYFNICKNKLTGDEDTIPELRHGSSPVRISAEYARYEDIM